MLKDDLVKKLKKISGASTLSALLNSCLADWIAQHGRRELKARFARESIVQDGKSRGGSVENSLTRIKRDGLRGVKALWSG